MTERTNEQWLADLRTTGAPHTQALEDLRLRLQRGLHFYLTHERSDLAERPVEELGQMADDFTQDALLKVIGNLDSFRGESLFTTWAAKIAARVAISELRRARWKDYSLDHLTDTEEAGSLEVESDGLTPGPVGPEDYTERKEIMERIEQAIQTDLTGRQRMALMAYVVDDLPVEEIAARLNTNRNALYKLLHDARLKLRRSLERQGISLDYMTELFEVM